MTAVAQRPAGPVDASTPRARRRRPRYLVVFGLSLVVAVIAGITLIILSFGGNFTNYDAVTAQVPASSTAVPLNSPVEYRNVSVGKVANTGSGAVHGLVSLALHIDPGQLSHIPANVRATVAPVSIFGNQYVVLQAPANPSSTPLAKGAVIPALLTDKTASLQNTLGDLDGLLTELHPQLLDSALTAVAGALQGQGYNVGQTLVRGHAYLGAMQPLWPTVLADLKTLVPVANTVAGATSDLVGIAGNSVAPSQTVTDTGTSQVQALFSGGATLAGQAAGLLANIQQPFSILTAASGPFLDDISNNPMEIAQVLSGLSTWASTWAAAEQSGPYLNLTATVDVANPADLALALLGGPLATTDLSEGLGSGYVNPPTYTSSAVPPAATVTAASRRSAAASASTAVLPQPLEQNAVGRIVQGMTGSAPASPAVASLLMQPVLESLVTQK